MNHDSSGKIRNPTIESKRLLLRPLRFEDWGALAELDSDPEVMRHINGGEPVAAEIVRERQVPAMLKTSQVGLPFGFWTALLLVEPAYSGSAKGKSVLADDGLKFAGWFHLKPAREEAGAVELGYRLRRELWGRGLATEGAKNLMSRAHQEWGLERLVATTLKANLASQSVLKKCGFTLEREFIYAESLLPDWPVDRRRAMFFSVDFKGAAGERLAWN